MPMVLLVIVVIAAIIATYRLFFHFRDRREGIRPLPGGVKHMLLIGDFAMDPKAVAALKCRVVYGRYARESVRYIGVFDPKMPTAGAILSSDYRNDRRALLFEARVWKNDFAYLEDRRGKQPLFLRE